MPCRALTRLLAYMLFECLAASFPPSRFSPKAPSSPSGELLAHRRPATSTRTASACVDEVRRGLHKLQGVLHAKGRTVSGTGGFFDAKRGKTWQNMANHGNTWYLTGKTRQNPLTKRQF